jgi:putative membrane protein
MRSRWMILFAALLLVAALGACKKSEDTQQSASETTDTAAAQSASQTDTMTATTTGSTGGTVSNMSGDDKEFVTKAAIGGMAEVQMGQLASSKATSADVKAFGQRMVTDHSQANDELKSLATTKGLALPTDLDDEHKDAMQKVSTKTGKDFDKAYVDDMVKDHEKDVAEFQKQSTSATDPDLKAWAAKTLPTLQQHLQMIKDIQSKMK